MEEAKKLKGKERRLVMEKLLIERLTNKRIVQVDFNKRLITLEDGQRFYIQMNQVEKIVSMLY